MLVRSGHARTGRYGFYLTDYTRYGVHTFWLVCIDKATGLAHVLCVPAQKGLSYVSYTAAQVRRQAVLTLRYTL